MSVKTYRCESAQKVNEDFLYVEQIPKRVKYYNKLYFFLIFFVHIQNTASGDTLYTLYIMKGV